MCLLMTKQAELPLFRRKLETRSFFCRDGGPQPASSIEYRASSIGPRVTVALICLAFQDVLCHFGWAVQNFSEVVN